MGLRRIHGWAGGGQADTPGQRGTEVSRRAWVTVTRARLTASPLISGFRNIFRLIQF